MLYDTIGGSNYIQCTIFTAYTYEITMDIDYNSTQILNYNIRNHGGRPKLRHTSKKACINNTIAKIAYSDNQPQITTNPYSTTGQKTFSFFKPK